MIPDSHAAVDCPRLFVYGTLRRGFRLHYHLERLGAGFEREAKVAGELFDLGPYPGARPSNETGKWIHGELFHLPHPAQGLTVLDRVEDFIPSAPERSEFIRALVEAVLPDGTRETAWIYWLSEHAQRNRRRIDSGDYAGGRAQSDAIRSLPGKK